MKTFKIEDGYLLRVDKGEELVSSVLNFVSEHSIGSASVSAIGAVSDCVLGYFDRGRKTYLSKTFSDVYELVSLSGNITFLDSQPILHAHACISDSDCNAFGGHLFSALVAVTAEVVLVETGTRITRSIVEEFGLNLIDTEE